MSYRLPSSLSLLALAASFAATAHAQDTTLAGWTFSQFLGAGYPELDGENGGAVDHIAATYRGAFVPESNIVDGTITSANGLPGYNDPAFGAWSFADFDTANASDVRADTFGAFNFANSVTPDGNDMALSDAAGMMLTFRLLNTAWTLTVADTTGHANAAGPDFTYAARGNGGAATIEWLFNNIVFATQTVAAGPGFTTYSHELPPGFYGNGAIRGRLVSGAVSFDNVQVNGRLGTPPAFTDQPDSLVRLVGESATFTAVVSGATSPTYQWFKGAGPINGANFASYTIDPVSLASSGSYRVRVTSSNGLFAESEFATLEVRQTPSITQPPAAQIANPGQNVSFTVVATGTPAPVFRWRRNGSDLVDGGNISGASTATLTVSGVSEADEGDYRVIVENIVGSAASAAVALTVTDLSIPPSVSTPPVDTVGVVGGTVELTVTAAGAPAPTFQWFFNDEPLTDGPGVSGATTARLVLANLAAGQAGAYRVTITNSAGSEEREAMLEIQAPPELVSGPGPSTRFAVAGSDVTFHVVATGDPTPTYQWFHDNEELDGETGPTLILPDVGADDDGAYFVRIVNPAGSVDSPVSTLRVGTAPTITEHPRSAVAPVGGSVTLSVRASGNPAPTYQWLLNDEEIPDATGPALRLSDLTAADAGVYTVRVANSFATELTAPALLRVAQTVDRSRPGRTQTFAPGSTLQIGTATSGNSELRFEWFRNGKRIPGVTGPVLSLPETTFGDSGEYSVRIYNSKGRFLATQLVARINISVANSYDLFLRESGSEAPAGIVRLSVARNGAFTGNFQRLEGDSLAFRGSFAFPDRPDLGVASVVVPRRNLPALTLALTLDAKLSAVVCEIVGGEASLAAGPADRRLASNAAWAGRYALTLTPKPEPDADTPPPATALKAVIGAKGALNLTGRMADGSRVTYSAQSSVSGAYALLLSPYKKGTGFVTGELQLESSPAGYFADEESSGTWLWKRAASANSPALDLPISPALATAP